MDSSHARWVRPTAFGLLAVPVMSRCRSRPVGPITVVPVLLLGVLACASAPAESEEAEVEFTVPDLIPAEIPPSGLMLIGDTPSFTPSSARIAVSALGLEGPIALSTLTGDQHRVLVPGPARAPDWSPSGDRIVYVEDRGGGSAGLSLTDTLGNIRLLATPRGSDGPQFSRDGEWIYFFREARDGPRIHRIRPSGFDLETLFAGSHPSPSPDGDRLALIRDGRVWVVDIRTGTGAPVSDQEAGSAGRWAPDGRWIAYRSERDSTLMIRPDGSDSHAFPTAGRGGLAWSPDSSLLLVGTDRWSSDTDPTAEGPLVLIDVETGDSSELWQLAAYPAWHPRAAPLSAGELARLQNPRLFDLPSIDQTPSFTPFTVAPVVQNRAEIASALEREYPAELREAGTGGRASVWVRLDVEGVVQDVQINTSSGNPELDEAALRVARVMRFSPAMNRDRVVPVWVSIPVSFQPRR